MEVNLREADSAAIFDKGLQAHTAGDLSTAEQLYQETLAIQPEHCEANHNIGVILVAKNELDKALEFFKFALDNSPNVSLFWASYIDVLIKLERIGESKTLVKAVKQAGISCDKIEALSQRLDVEHQDPGPKESQDLNKLLDQQKFDDAIKATLALMETYPSSAVLNITLGQCHFELGQIEPAINSYQRAIEINPECAEAYFNMGIILKDKGDLDAAIENYQKVIKIDPNSAVAYNNIAIAFQAKGDLDSAIKYFEKALSIEPNCAQTHINMGITFKARNELKAAIKSYKKVIQIDPCSFDAYNSVGNAFLAMGDIVRALDSYRQAIKIKPDYAEAYLNMGHALEEQGKLEEAIEACNKALAIKPGYANAYFNMASTLEAQGKLEEAIEAYNKALSFQPDYVEAHINLSFALLNTGRLQEGLDASSEWRFKTGEGLKNKRHFSKPMWDGERDLNDKTILVWSEQGIGDTVKWSSRLSLLASQAGHCILECPEKLIPLLSRSFPNVEVKSQDRSQDTKREDFDYHLPMGSLYRHFIPEITQSPKPDAFLIPDPVRVKFWKDRLSFLGTGPCVGISWKSLLMEGKLSKHFSSILEWSSLLTLPNLNFINLQYADAEDGLLQIQNEFGVKVHNFDDLDQYDNLDDVAALSAALDCVVSFGTSVSMITAGVGTPTKLACLHQHINFYNSPVGPFLDIYERKTGEPWSNVFGLIAEDTKKLKARCFA